jgi:hypothetical protein
VCSRPQRFELLGTAFMSPDDECVLLTGGERISLVDSVELRYVRNRDEPVEVYRLA